MLTFEKNKVNNGSSIMEPMESLSLTKAELFDAMKADGDYKIDLNNQTIPTLIDNQLNMQRRSFLLMDGNENLHVSTPEMFIRKLGCSENDKIKVVSIFGNTGDGKSHTMNHAFFNGDEIFKTSAEQNSCTIGVSAAMQKSMGVLCLDTEGLLGTTSNPHRIMRMLLKVLAISDIVIYRTRSERLHSDMFNFLGTASKAFCTHFAQALKSLSIPGTAKTLGPAVIVFHETRHTKPLESNIQESTEDKLRDGFSNANMDTNAFSSLRYVGIQSKGNQTDYSKLTEAISFEIHNTSVRSSRQPGVIFRAMKALNLKFSGEITEQPVNPFPEQYFTCTVSCESCNRRCQRSMGHISDGENHMNSHPCMFQAQYENKVYLCKVCYINGREVVVTIRSQGNQDNSWSGLVNYAWKGSVIDCQNCGEIYRSRQYWYGNKSPEDLAVRSEIVHVWEGGNIVAKGPLHSAQMVLDGVSYISEAISCIGSQPSKVLSDWVADKVAPSYWKPNSEIIRCHACTKNFDSTGLKKHHCRRCGEGFCNACSQHKMPVLSRGWTQDVRVCNECRKELLKNSNTNTEIPINNHCNNNTTGPPSDETDVIVRKYGETLYNTISSVAFVLEYPKDLIKQSARPNYWVPDSEAINCHICETQFGTAEELVNVFNIHPKSNGNHHNNGGSNNVMGDCRRHHCRSCGQGVCETCSQTRRPVPEHGWTTDVRVCDFCENEK